MPTYEFECKKCKKDFKILSRTFLRGAEKINCPYCESADVERQCSPYGFGDFCDAGSNSSSGFR